MFKVITAPTAEAITRAEAKLHLRVDDVGGVHPDDTLIDGLITAAREYAQHYTQTSIGSQTLELALDEFPGTDKAIELRRGPVSSITSIKYADPAFPYEITSQGTTAPSDADGSDGDVYWRTDTDQVYVKTSGSWVLSAWTRFLTFSSARYALNDYDVTGAVAPVYGASWPVARAETNAVKVRYVAGATVPVQVKRGMLLMIAHWYENREAINIGNVVNEIPMSAHALLDTVRVYGY